MKVILPLILINLLFADVDIYIWSNSFNNYSNTQIVKLLKKYHIKNAIVSFSDKIDIKKLENFQKQYNTQLLISDNNFIYPKNREKLLKKIAKTTKYEKIIHLDIEPHTIKSLKKNRELYLNWYIEMLKSIKTNFPNVIINISIPTFYNVDYVAKMQKYVNKIYLMAYEFKNYSNLLHRISKYKNFNIVVALRCQDFKSKKSLFETINRLKKDGYKTFAIHDFKIFITLED